MDVGSISLSNINVIILSFLDISLLFPMVVLKILLLILTSLIARGLVSSTVKANSISLTL